MSNDSNSRCYCPRPLVQPLTYDLGSMKRVLLLLSIAISSSIVAPRAIVAQLVEAVPYAIRSKCLDTMSVTPTVPSIVYVRAVVADSVSGVVGPTADIFAQSVGLRLRVLLHERGDTLPAGEPAITWRGITPGTPLVVRMVRNSEPVYELMAPHADSVAGAMLLAAAHIASDSGEAPFWPEDFHGDTLVFGVSFALTAAGAMRLPGSGRAALPVFSVMFPPETPARPPAHSAPKYPEDLLRMGVTGVVIVTFVVDTTGHPIPASIKDVWAPSQKLPTGELLSYYTEFAQSVFKWIKTAKLTPARLGGCPVPQLVTEPFTFSITH